MAHPTPQRHATDQAPPEFGASLHILLIEDCPSDVFLVRKMLRAAPVQAHCMFSDVPRLTDAFSRVQQQPFDLILLDLNLLDMNGVVSIAVLHEEVPHIPIIVYSGMTDAHLKQRALECGATAYLVKGEESPENLAHVLNNALTRKNRHQQNTLQVSSDTTCSDNQEIL